MTWIRSTLISPQPFWWSSIPSASTTWPHISISCLCKQVARCCHWIQNAFL